MFPFMAVLNKWRKISIQDFSARFSNPLLREAFPLIWLPEFPMLSLLMTFAWLHTESAGYPFYNFDPTFAEAGKTVLKVMLPSDYNYWQSLREDPERYRAEKEKISDKVVSLLDKRFPGMSAQVEMRDVATPVTFHRYTGNLQGNFEGWMITPETWNMRMNKTLSGLDNFYMIGQWVEPGGGLPPAAYSGRNLIQILCKKDKKPFVTTIP